MTFLLSVTDFTVADGVYTADMVTALVPVWAMTASPMDRTQSWWIP